MFPNGRSNNFNLFKGQDSQSSINSISGLNMRNDAIEDQQNQSEFQSIFPTFIETTVKGAGEFKISKIQEVKDENYKIQTINAQSLKSEGEINKKKSKVKLNVKMVNMAQKIFSCIVSRQITSTHQILKLFQNEYKQNENKKASMRRRSYDVVSVLSGAKICGITNKGNINYNQNRHQPTINEIIYKKQLKQQIQLKEIQISFKKKQRQWLRSVQQLILRNDKNPAKQQNRIYLPFKIFDCNESQAQFIQDYRYSRFSVRSSKNMPQYQGIDLVKLLFQEKNRNFGKIRPSKCTIRTENTDMICQKCLMQMEQE